MAVVVPSWVVCGFLVAQLVVGSLIWLLNVMNVPLASLNESVFTTGVAALIYLITLLIVIGLPWVVRKKSISLEDIGLHRLPSWMDIWMAPAGFIVYLLLSAVFIYIAMALLPGFDVGEAQETGFSQLNLRYEYILAFFTLVVVAPIAEEVLFRGYLFGRLQKFVPVWIAILVTSVLFGLVHGAWNVAIDTFALSIVMCVLRVSTGSLWAPILLHMTKNGIAFYVLFINPTLLTTLGG